MMTGNFITSIFLVICFCSFGHGLLAEDEICGKSGENSICSYKDALRLLRADIDRGDPKAVENFKRVTKNFKKTIENYKLEAKKEEQDGRMALVLLQYRKVWDIDDEDKDILAYYQSHQAKISYMMKLVFDAAVKHCKDGQIDDARLILEKGQWLDPQDRFGFGLILKKMEKKKGACPEMPE
jgi:hypothetical protein